LYIKIQWGYPNDNSDAIIAYLIEIRSSDGTTFIESPECDGSQVDVVQ
jgi:hypothetical protein